LISFILIAVATAIAAGRSVADIPNVHVSDRSSYVSNPDGVLSERAERQLNNMLAGLWERTSAEVVVVAVADLDRPD
ncbi:TPM domain-containing protein, partial [Klebsiella oxytoca]